MKEGKPEYNTRKHATKDEGARGQIKEGCDLLSWGLGAWLISIMSLVSSIWCAMVSAMRVRNVTNAVDEYL